MESIKSGITTDIAQKIFGNKKLAEDYLLSLNKVKAIPSLKFKVFRRTTHKKVLEMSTEEVWQAVVLSWDYEISKGIIRKMFTKTSKYKVGKKADKLLATLLKEWGKLNLGPIKWSFSQGAFDAFVQSVNAQNISRSAKDRKVKLAAVQYRRIKEINTMRNDLIETLIFEKNENIIPTLNHSRGVDFFIDGVAYDQKVSKSPTDEFKKAMGAEWRGAAINDPGLVAKYLYQYQDEGRFGEGPRLYVVYLDEDVNIEKMKQIIQKTDLEDPLGVNFSYIHKNTGERKYEKVPCFVVLLYN